jgi:cysteinyl-tRNA synthetase
MVKALQIYNTLTKSLETFEPIKKGSVSMYVCGPTVYGDIHIGNARPVIFFDVVKRFLEAIGYQVNYVSNITDVDDKIIEKAKAEGISESQLTSQYIEAFVSMVKALGSDLPNSMPKATEYISQMIHYIKTLIEKGFAYETQQGVYFRVNRIHSYGELSKQKREALEQAVRIDLDQDKEHPNDFSIWKKTTDGLNYHSPWGEGRPGWHTECAVMNHEIFDGMIDIHGGGSDLMFPHHENERAQALAHDQHGLATYWMHNARLDIENQKMSKSLGNVIYVKDLNDIQRQAFRLLILAHHYRQPIQYSSQLLEQYEKNYLALLKKLRLTKLELLASNEMHKTLDVSYQTRLIDALLQDFHTAQVVTILFEMQKTLNKAQDLNDKASILNTFEWLLPIIGLQLDLDVSSDIEIYLAWQEARHLKKYSDADIYRNQLMEKGYI